MNLLELKKQLGQEYIEKNGLKDSLISYSVLMQCKGIIPERKIVGKDEDGNIIFFEETAGSLQNRHYGKIKEPTSFNLVYSNGEKATKVTKNYLLGKNIAFTDDYDIAQLHYFIENNNNRFNALNREKRIKCSFYLTENEIETVNAFIRKMRKFKDERH